MGDNGFNAIYVYYNEIKSKKTNNHHRNENKFERKFFIYSNVRNSSQVYRVLQCDIRQSTSQNPAEKSLFSKSDTKI